MKRACAVRSRTDSMRAPLVFTHGSDEHVCGIAGCQGGQEPAVPAAEGAEAERRREPRPHRAPQSETDDALHDLHHI